MSTSPSWFDQEKFSRLVKKVGKTVPLPIPSPDQSGAEADNRPPGEGMASTARISLVSKPPSLLSENRSLPALPRRTGAMPAIKTHFQPIRPTPAPTPSPTQPAESALVDEPAPTPESSPEKSSVNEEPKAESPAAPSSEPLGSISDADENDLDELWQKMALLNEELAYAVQERDQALRENTELVGMLHEAQAVGKQPATPATPAPTGKTQELKLVTQERDGARKEYSELRKQYETLKSTKDSAKDDSAKGDKESEQVESLRQQLDAKTKEIAALKATASTTSVAGGGEEKMKEQLTSLRDQLARAKDEASVAQRGLMLSQKALHETRDTLREATEGTSLSRHNFDNLKNECATLAQQNTVLQAQNDQLTRDLAATKSKITSRL